LTSRQVLLDTNVVSERWRKRPDAAVAEFLGRLPMATVHVSVLTIGEMRRGAELKRRTDFVAAERLTQWLSEIEREFDERILPVDAATADLWGRLSAQRPRPIVDTLIAATAIVHGMTLVTRNIDDVRDTGARLVNPWTGEEV